MRVFGFVSYFVLLFAGAGLAFYLGARSGLDHPAWACGYTLMVLVLATTVHLIGLNTMHRIFDEEKEDKPGDKSDQ